MLMDTNLSTLPRFDWLRYADATFAGLALLIPIPLLDVAFECFFRRGNCNYIVREISV